jgi:para-aminobenzoate synthetase
VLSGLVRCAQGFVVFSEACKRIVAGQAHAVRRNQQAIHALSPLCQPLLRRSQSPPEQQARRSRLTLCSSLSDRSIDRSIDKPIDKPIGDMRTQLNCSSKFDLNVLLIDHYDSFTFNLVDLVAQVCLQPPVVRAHDAPDLAQLLAASSFDAIVLSPGPGHPSETQSLQLVRDYPHTPMLGVCLGHQILGMLHGAAIKPVPVPVHGQITSIQPQSANLTATVYPSLWQDLQPANVTRYHSLCVHSLPDTLVSTFISTTDKVCMSLQHAHYPHYGVQFHPESVGTGDLGITLITSFAQICLDCKRAKQAPEMHNTQHTESATSLVKKSMDANGESQSQTSSIQSASKADFTDSAPTPIYKVYMTRLSVDCDILPINLMNHFLASLDYTFWIDPSLDNMVSILGSATERIEYYGKEKPLQQQGVHVYKRNLQASAEQVSKWHKVYHNSTDNILSYLQNRHAHITDTVHWVDLVDIGTNITLQPHVSLIKECDLHVPFDYRGGHVGFLGYEVRHDTRDWVYQQEHGRAQVIDSFSNNPNDPHVPTAAFMWASRSFVYSASDRVWYLIGLAQEGECEVSMIEWMQSTAREIMLWKKSDVRIVSGGYNGDSDNVNAQTVNIRNNNYNDKQMNGKEMNGRYTSSSLLNGNQHKNGMIKHNPLPPRLTFVPNRSRQTYHDNFARCMHHIWQGDSYELCLTNQLEANARVTGSSPLDLYKILRMRNPAPHGAFFNWHGHKRQSTSSPLSQDDTASFSLCCSSPERFLSVKPLASPLSTNSPTSDNPNKPLFQVEAKPIKGTTARVHSVSLNNQLASTNDIIQDARRAQELQESVKNRAENLMIVDLLRNDMNRVCATGTVHVAKLMHIESFATVHQLVSTIRGQLDRDQTAIDVIQACFPGGSMTGAPKLRSMEILHELEKGVSRGPYSGSLGYISVNGCMDMNILIRTAVLVPTEKDDEWKVSVGAGGAITALSESRDEYDEMLLKARVVCEAVQEWAGTSKQIGDHEMDEEEGKGEETKAEIEESDDAVVLHGWESRTRELQLLNSTATK